MSTMTTTSGVEIFYKDWGAGQPIVFSHGWPLSSDEWDNQLLFFLENGYRVIAHDRRGHGRSSQQSEGHDMDHYADDLAALAQHLDLHDAVYVGHSTGGGEVVRYLARYVQSRAAKAVLIGAVSPLMVQTPANPAGQPQAVFDDLQAQLAELERAATRMLPEPGDAISSLDPSFRAQELSYIVSQIASNIDLAAAAERRSWFAQLLGRRPTGLIGPLAAAQERASAHVERHSVWLQNSVRGAVGLGLAVLVADVSEVSHGFWVVLGTLSVLRTNAAATGATALRALAGTAIGFVIGAALLIGIGTGPTALWVALPCAVFVAAYAPGTTPFAVGQAAFTITVVVIFNLLVPAGWQVGLLRIEDVAIGCGVSVVVGLLFWPRGAAGLVGNDLADEFRRGSSYLAQSVDFALGLRTAVPDTAMPAVTAGIRLDEALRAYLTEQGTNVLAWKGVTSEGFHARLAQVAKFGDVIKIRWGLVELAGLARTIAWSGTDAQKAKLAEARTKVLTAITEAKKSLNPLPSSSNEEGSTERHSAPPPPGGGVKSIPPFQFAPSASYLARLSASLRTS